jgi:hypothetical protein
MHVANIYAQIAWAMAGGAIGEFLHWYLLSRKPGGIKPYLPDWTYWLFSVGMIVIGGLMPILYLSGDATVLLCLQLGATAPIALQKVFSAVPSIVQKQGPGDAALGSKPGSFKSFLVW